jgi:hypothetical protein
MHPIAERIIAGESVCRSEINEFNASELVAWIADTDSHHTKADCPNGKDCVHAPGEMTADWAATLVSEAMFLCACGAHGSQDSDEAARIIKEFRDKWDRDQRRPAVVKGKR